MFNKDRIDDLDRRLSSVTFTVDRIVEHMNYGNMWGKPFYDPTDRSFWKARYKELEARTRFLEQENAELNKELEVWKEQHQKMVDLANSRYGRIKAAKEALE